MYQLCTEKQFKYFKEVIRLHYEEGYGEDMISKVLPIGHTTAARWIAIFAREKGQIFFPSDMPMSQVNNPSTENISEVEALQRRVNELEMQLKEAEIKAEFYDKMIDVAEAKFKIPIRKKAGAKQ